MWHTYPWSPVLLAFGLMLTTTLATAQDTTPAQLLKQYESAASAGNAVRGQHFFVSSHGREWQCASCHKARPVEAGQHASTGQAIRPLAPSANAARFTRLAKAEKWFKRNCNDVLNRSCTAQEKADVLAWLITLKP